MARTQPSQSQPPQQPPQPPKSQPPQPLISLVGVFITIIVGLLTILWNYILKRADYISVLQIELENLKEKKEQLNTLKQDVEKKIENEKIQDKQIVNTVQNWPNRVQSKQDEVERIIHEAEKEIDGKYIYFFPKHISFEEAGKKVQSAFKSVDELIKEGNNFVVIFEKKTYVVDERPVGKTVGLDAKFKEVCDCLGSVGTIGIYGMGGVGKTTLLKKINNKFLGINTTLLRTSNDVDAVIWVVVSKEANLEKIQEAIRQKLNIPDDMWKSKNEDDRAAEIWRHLKEKRFVLLLDDLWERLDLLKVGVPLLEETNSSKVVFTTRSKKVCGSMGADRTIKVDCLAKEDSKRLFKMYVGQKTLNAHPEIPKLAELVAAECKGLPLALITVGRALAAIPDPQQWRSAIKVLESYPSSFSGIGGDVFPVLKYSYEMLPDDTHKRCFEYCSIFPEDHDICKEELIELWIREGILDKFKSLYDAQKFGEYVVGNLKLLCLLEDTEPYYEYDYWNERVKMHDMIRAMALWLACAEGRDEGKIVVLEHGGSTGTGGFQQWKEVERLSIWFTNINLSRIASCTVLQTLIIRYAGLTEVPGEILQHMQCLNILDLSENVDLRELPIKIGELSNLQHLNLSGTGIRFLPSQIGNLKNLKSLILDNTGFLGKIQRGIMSKLSSLQVFSVLFTDYESEIIGDGEILDELEGLQDMVDMSIELCSVGPIEKLLNSPTLQGCLKRLFIGFCDDLTTIKVSPSSLRRMEHIEVLQIESCNNLQEVKLFSEEDRTMQRFVNDNSNLSNVHRCFANLRHLKIIECFKLKHLTWVKYLSSLETIHLSDCQLMVEVIADESGSTEIEEIEQDIDIFSNLRELCLVDMNCLEHICQQALLFPSLKTLGIYGCPSLKKLPFGSGSAKNLEKIEAEIEFWEALEWENVDDDTIRYFFSKLQSGIFSMFR